MTVVAVRDGIMAADTECNDGSMKFALQKIFVRNGIAVGVSGVWADGKVFADWYFNGHDLGNLPAFPHRPDGRPDFSALVLHGDGRWEFWDNYFVCEDMGDHGHDFFAIGSGAQAAMVAMFMGADADEAVKTVNMFAVHCSGGPRVWNAHVQRWDD